MENYSDTRKRNKEERNIKCIKTFLEICSFFKKGIICLRDSDSIINPILSKYNFYKYRREFFLLIDAIFEYNSRTPVSV